MTVSVSGGSTLRGLPLQRFWVSFYDLPEETRNRLLAKHRRELAFPAGLEGLEELEEGAIVE